MTELKKKTKTQHYGLCESAVRAFEELPLVSTMEAFEIFQILASRQSLSTCWHSPITGSRMPFMAYPLFGQFTFTSLHLSDGTYTFQAITSDQEGLHREIVEVKLRVSLFAFVRVEPMPVKTFEKVQLSNTFS